MGWSYAYAERADGGARMNRDDATLLCSLLSERLGSHDHITDSQWRRIVDLAEMHSLAPFLYTRIKKVGIKVGTLIEERLREIYLVAAKRNLLLFYELDHITGELNKRGIHVVLVKGAWLASEIYENKALRQMGDADLWIKRCDLQPARETLSALGYEAHSAKDRPQVLQDAYGGETKLFKQGAPLVELHWRIFSGEWLRYCAQIDEEQIWQRTLPLKGEGLRRLSNEDAVVHLCVHLAVNHQMSLMALRTLVDLDLLRQRAAVDWVKVAKQAIAWKVSRATWVVLNALKEVFGDPEGSLPLRELEPPPWCRFVMGKVASPKALGYGAPHLKGRSRYLYLLALADNPTRALILFFRALFPERNWLLLRYGLEQAGTKKIIIKRLMHPFQAFTNRRI